MVIATVLVALPGLPIQSSLLTLIQFDDEHVKALDDEGEHRNVQVLGHDVSISSASTKCRRQSFGEGLRRLEDLVKENDRLLAAPPRKLSRSRSINPMLFIVGFHFRYCFVLYFILISKFSL